MKNVDKVRLEEDDVESKEVYTSAYDKACRKV